MSPSPADADSPPSAAGATTQPSKPKKTQPFLGPLVAYNALAAILWTVVLGRTVALVALQQGSVRKVWLGTGEFVKWTQTMALAEVLFSATGIVRAPLFTTAMQVASRLFLVWGPTTLFTTDTVFSRAYASMLLAWSITEVIRYSFFASNLALGSVPAPLLWLRYNTFFVLYPIGISSEAWLVFRSIWPAWEYSPLLGAVWIGVLVVYIPGSYILYTHMMAQRRKVLRAAREEKLAKTQ